MYFFRFSKCSGYWPKTWAWLLDDKVVEVGISVLWLPFIIPITAVAIPINASPHLRSLFNCLLDYTGKLKNSMREQLGYHTNEQHWGVKFIYLGHLFRVDNVCHRCIGCNHSCSITWYVHHTDYTSACQNCKCVLVTNLNYSLLH